MPELSRIAAVSGQGGLFSVHTALKNGVVLESLDEKKTKLVTGATSKVSILSEISIYTTTGEGSVSLESVLQALYKKHGGPAPVSAKSDGSELRRFLVEVLPEADLERVYTSDIKKLASWYNLLATNYPDLLKPEEKQEEKPEEEGGVKGKKASAKKSPQAKEPSSEGVAEKPTKKEATAKAPKQKPS